jgi:hypothetical protein
VYLGDTITVDYTIAAIDEERRRSTGDIRITNRDGTQVAAGTPYSPSGSRTRGARGAAATAIRKELRDAATLLFAPPSAIYAQRDDRSSG